MGTFPSLLVLKFLTVLSESVTTSASSTKAKEESGSVSSGSLLLCANCATAWQNLTESRQVPGLEVVENRLMKQVKAAHSFSTKHFSNY